MFGFRFIKAQPTEYVIQFRNGRPRREGAGLTMVYFAPTSSLVVVPTASVNDPFMFEEVTADYQDVTSRARSPIGSQIHGARRPARISPSNARGRYVSEDPQKLSQRLISEVRVAMRARMQALPCKGAAPAKSARARGQDDAAAGADIAALGLEVLGLSILAIKPTPETARALEAEAREELLRRADEAIYSRRNAAVEQERAIKENELNTEIAVENKKRQIGEAQIDAERAMRERRARSNRRRWPARSGSRNASASLVALATANAREEADAKAYGIDAMMKAFAASDPKVLQALASVGMQPGQLLALAFRDLADNADKDRSAQRVARPAARDCSAREAAAANDEHEPGAHADSKIVLVVRADPARRTRHAVQHGAAGAVLHRASRRRFLRLLDRARQLPRRRSTHAEDALRELGRVQRLERRYLPNFVFGKNDIVVVLGPGRAWSPTRSNISTGSR